MFEAFYRRSLLMGASYLEDHELPLVNLKFIYPYVIGLLPL